MTDDRRAHGTADPDRSSAFRWQALHVVALSALALAHPLLDTVARNSEFLVAHRAGPAEIFAVLLVLLLLVPAVPLAAAWLAGRLSRRLQPLVILSAIFVLSAILALQLLKRLGLTGTGASVAAAAATALVLVRLYVRAPAVRSFASVLGLAVVVVPGVFLFGSSVGRLWWPGTPPPRPPALAEPRVPIVVVVFDQFPLVSLLDAEGTIDQGLFPSFAALARESTWFRGASAVGDRTAVALPALATGIYPRERSVPTAGDHPNSLFTWLRNYDLRVREPITALCPTDLCRQPLVSVAARVGRLLADLGVVALHISAPAALEAELPPLSQNWRNFNLPGWHLRWLRQRQDDRRAAFLRDIEEIQPAGDRPPFYFAHVLLPHEPFIYYPSGRAFTASTAPLAGLLPVVERWGDDLAAVASGYQRHLQQVRMVDGLLGALVDRLKQVDLYDSALIVITADHGASFRPGESFRGPSRQNFADIASVPLFVKAPHQRTGRVDDRAVETIDIVPTMADLLETEVPWAVSGASAFGEPRPDRRRLFYGGARLRQVFTTRQLRQRRNQALRLKLDLFGAPVDPDRIAWLDAARVIGQRVESLPRGEPSGRRVFVDLSSRHTPLGSIDDFVPGLLSGSVSSPSSGTTPRDLAVAVDGTIRAVARPFAAYGGRVWRWEVLLPESVLESGAERVEVFEVIPAAGGQLALGATGVVTEPGGPANLLSRAVQARLGVEEAGIYGEEQAGGIPFRWTSGAARLTLPIDPDRPPRRITVNVAMPGRPERRLAISLDGCELYAGPVPRSSWQRTFALQQCPLDGPTATLEIAVDPFVPGAGDSRELGIGLAHVTLEH